MRRPETHVPARAAKRMIPWSRKTNEAGTPSVWSAKAPTMKPAKRKATASVPAKLAPARAAITIAMNP